MEENLLQALGLGLKRPVKEGRKLKVWGRGRDRGCSPDTIHCATRYLRRHLMDDDHDINESNSDNSGSCTLSENAGPVIISLRAAQRRRHYFPAT